ncbi:cell division protein ZapD [Thalassotalea sp. PLHSN55]|uniref:cell division protein ZapD n=1 Tax=Thalassotalea sp. PLHSN55 TaxID=3435888 RepID=UPI003F82AEAA
MTTILYEHPLNERIRSYLKLEQLFVQVNDALACGIEVSQGIFFNSFFAIIDTLERNDIRGDLIKDLEKLEQNLIVWSQAPNVDSTTLEQNLKHTVSLICKLRCPRPKWWQLKDDKFLATVKQRFAIQGGSSSFDLPQLQFWLHQPKEVQQQQIKQWLSLLDQIKYALELVLKFLRMRADFKHVQSSSGFYQDSGEGILLLRIKLDETATFYPTVSGNKFRFSIRFMHPCSETGRKYSNQATEFQLAKC